MTLHAFADDTQLYLPFHRDDMASSALRLECSLLEVSRWMSSNRLKLNADETELLLAGSRRILVLYWVTARVANNREPKYGTLLLSLPSPSLSPSLPSLPFFLPFPSPPFPFLPFPFPSPSLSPFLPLPSQSPPLRSRPPKIQLGGLGERCKP